MNLHACRNTQHSSIISHSGADITCSAIATGEQHAVRDFIRWAAADLGITLRFEGAGLDERGIVESVAGDMAPAVQAGDCVVVVDPRYFRPAEVQTLLGDASRARDELGWRPETSARAMCAEMVAEDLKAARRTALLRTHGHDVTRSHEAGA